MTINWNDPKPIIVENPSWLPLAERERLYEHNQKASNSSWDWAAENHDSKRRVADLIAGKVDREGNPFGGSPVSTKSPGSVPDNDRQERTSLQSPNPTLPGGGSQGATSAANLARLMQLWNNPLAAVSEALSGMGIGEYNTGPLANFMRSKKDMLKPAYYLARGGDTSGMTSPDDYLKFAQNFLGSAGASLGDKGSLVRNALGLNQGMQSQGWKELLSGTNPQTGMPWLDDRERANWIGSMYDVMNMGSFNPFRGYMAARIDRTPAKFAQEYGSGRAAEKADYMDYIRTRLPELFGW